MRLLILSDIHGNLSALEAVLAQAARLEPDAVALLGDYIDYGMRSNEAVGRLAALGLPAACALWGNHEASIIAGDYSRFSSRRGAECARRTASLLSDAARAWLLSLPGRGGCQTFILAGRSFLAVHGSLEDPFWGAVSPKEASVDGLDGIDVVLSGHSHVPHAFSLFAEADDPVMRNRRRVDFVNPGSVGQPRNHCPRACYAVWDSEAGVTLASAEYPVEAEQALFDRSVDDFYRARLALGV